MSDGFNENSTTRDDCTTVDTWDIFVGIAVIDINGGVNGACSEVLVVVGVSCVECVSVGSPRARIDIGEESDDEPEDKAATVTA